MFFLYFLIFNSEQNVHSLVWKQEKGRFSTEALAKAALIWTKNTLLSWATHKGTSDIIKIISRLTPQYSGTWMKWAVINGVKVHKLRNVFQTLLTQLHRSLILSAYLLSVNSRESLNECVVIQQPIWRKYLKKHRYSTENSIACLCHPRLTDRQNDFGRSLDLDWNQINAIYVQGSQILKRSHHAKDSSTT